MHRPSLTTLIALGILSLPACSDDVTPPDSETSSTGTSSGTSGTDTRDTTIDEPGISVTEPGTTTDTPHATPGLPETTTTDTTDTTTQTTGDPVTCVEAPDLCGPGTVCDPASQTCVADCSDAPDLCGPGSVCQDGLCGPICADGVDHCDAGTVCGPDLECVVDCRTNLLDVCAGQALCNRGTGLCEVVDAIDCAVAPGLCFEDQTCDASGYCRAAALDLELAYDVQHYDLRLDILTASKTFSGEVAIFLAATVDGTAEVVLDIGPETLVNGAPYLPYAVESVTDALGQPLEFSAGAGALTVQLAAPLAQDEATVLKVRYAGAFNPVTKKSDPRYYTGLMQRAGKQGDFIQTFSWPIYTRNWLPSHDHPRDTASFSVDVGIDNDYLVLANGAPVRSGERDGLHRAAYVLQQPVPPHVMQIVASQFEVVRLGVVQGVAVDAVVHAAEEPLAAELLGATVDALALFDDLMFDYPFSRFAMVAVPMSFGGMEHASIVSLHESFFTPGNQYARSTAIHELAHHWAGDTAHLGEWQAYWLNESLAELLTLEALRALAGQAAHDDYLAALRDDLYASPQLYNDDALHYEVAQDYPGQITEASASAPYNKGAMVWHMLRQQLGAMKMSKFLFDLFNQHRFAPYTTDSALATLNASTGQDFTQFFEEWVHTAGWPELQTTWNYDAVTQQVQLTVKQVQDPKFGVYTLDGALDLDYVFDDGDANTPTCDVSLAFTGGATEVAGAVACPQAPTSYTISSLPDLIAEQAP